MKPCKRLCCYLPYLPYATNSMYVVRCDFSISSQHSDHMYLETNIFDAPQPPPSLIRQQKEMKKTLKFQLQPGPQTRA